LTKFVVVLVGVAVASAAALVPRWLDDPYQRAVEDVARLSLAVSGHAFEHGPPRPDGDANAAVVRRLGDRLPRDARVVGGRAVDLWGTPYAVFLCDPATGDYPDVPFAWAGQEVRPARHPDGRPVNPWGFQIRSAGPDRRFGTADDVTSWDQPAE
jgi:hypothetical protein